MEDYLLNLNKKQVLAVTSDLCSTLVVAGAGSGKTAVLVYRIIHLVKDIGFSPKRILAFTFTNKAANEMKNRISKILSDATFNWIGTFHSTCLRILREDSHKINRPNNFMIVDEDEQLSIIRNIYSKRGINKSIVSHALCLKTIGTLKNNKIEYDDCLDEIDMLLENDENQKKANIIQSVYKDYEQYLIDNNFFDFDDLITYTLKLFKEDYETLNKWRKRFDYILVDEFQDTNLDQYELIKLLCENKTNIFVVGDPDQMIYSWRGAYEGIFKDFVNEFNDVYSIILDKNYRSTKNILDVSNKLITRNSNRVKKDLHTDNDQGTKILYYNAPTQDLESLWVIDKIKTLIHSEKYTYSDIAILYRSNYVSRNIEQELIRSNIPYYIFGGFKFYQRKEIKDMIAYLKLISNNDELSLSRIYNTPKRKISENTLTKIREFAFKNDMTLFDVFDHLDEIDLNSAAKNACLEFREMIYKIKNIKFKSLTDMFDHVLETTGYKQMLLDEEETNRLENLDELKNAISQFEFKNPNSTIIEYLQEISLYTTLDEKDEKSIMNTVSLMTVHLAKGLEFKNVFIIEFNDGIFPSQRAVDANDVQEERRIAYVAMTRAKENLFIASSDGTTFTRDCSYQKAPSRFINEIKSNPNIELIGNTFAPKDNKQFINNYDDIKKYTSYFHENEQNYQIADIVCHSKFGDGVVISIKDNILEIKFKHPYGIKHILKDHKTLVRKLS